MRLFTALWPPEAVIAHLRQALDPVPLPDGVRRVPAERWHLTLAFHGDGASLPERAAHLDEQVSGRPGLTLRLAGVGTFSGVLWVGVEPATAADRNALHALATASGADERFHPHVTVGRWRRQRRPRALTSVVEPLAGYRGPSWRATEVSLVRSTPGAGYVTVHRVPLITW